MAAELKKVEVSNIRDMFNYIFDNTIVVMFISNDSELSDRTRRKLKSIIALNSPAFKEVSFIEIESDKIPVAVKREMEIKVQPIVYLLYNGTFMLEYNPYKESMGNMLGDDNESRKNGYRRYKDSLLEAIDITIAINNGNGIYLEEQAV